ncbi:MAG: cysteine--tRNA ligase [Pseudomonadota bacterium]
MTIRLYNSAKRDEVDFTPLEAGKPSMYVCGPTVYDRAHLGNARPVVVFDVLYRLLRHEYGAENVTYVRNFTDVDDKINAKAAETGRDIRDITDETIAWFHEDMGALGALKPNHMPRATEYIPQMIAMISELEARGLAYAAEGHVLFRVDKYEGYGALSGRSVDDMIAGARVEVAPYKENPMDFVMWKPSEGNVPGWDSPWGYGRPGWHIECSAMARELLGETFDIHGGGLDLQFPHHENEIAQSKACCGQDSFAQIWMHNEMLQVEGKKMSKSLGNFFTVKDLLDGNWSGGWKVPGEVIRFVMLSTHYRKPMDWTEEKAREGNKRLSDYWQLVKNVVPAGAPHPAVLDALKDDLNVSLALTKLQELRNETAHGRLDAGVFFSSLKFLGFFDYSRTFGSIGWGERSREDLQLARLVGEKWMDLRTQKNFEAADDFRDKALSLGIELKAMKDGGEQSFNADFSGSLDKDAVEELI